MIERQLFTQYLNTLGTRKAVDWPSRYCCFESSCRPVAHIKSDEHKLLDQAIAMVHNQHPHLSNASSPSELRDRDYLVDKKFLEICRRERVITRKWLGIQGWTTAMSDQREGELPRYRTVSTRSKHLYPYLTAVQAHTKALWPGALCHAREHGH
jgi:hypothetical protein